MRKWSEKMQYKEKYLVGKPRTPFKVGDSYAITIPPDIYRHHIKLQDTNLQFIVTKTKKGKKQIILKPK